MQGEFAQAACAYRHMLTIVPSEAAARVGLGVCLLELGQMQDALESFSASRSSDKMFGESLTALTLARRGRFWLRPSAASRALREKL